jgi:predicted acylesterase/phospholipase RssA
VPRAASAVASRGTSLAFRDSGGRGGTRDFRPPSLRPEPERDADDGGRRPDRGAWRAARGGVAGPVVVLGLVLTAGGARGAYQAGVLRRIGELPGVRDGPLPFRIIAGASAGAIKGPW